MMSTPLFPARAAGLHLSPYTYDMLGKLVRRVMSWVFSVNEKDAALTPCTAYSLRIGGAVALHDAGADGLVIAAMHGPMAQRCISDLYPNSASQGDDMDCADE